MTLSADTAGGVEGGKFGTLERVKMSDSDTEDLEGLARNSAERDFGGVDCGVPLGVHIDGSDLTDVEDNDSGSVESEASIFMHTSVLGVPVAVHEDVVKGISTIVSLLNVLEVGASVVFVVACMSGGLAFEFPADDCGVRFEVFFCSAVFL